MLYSIGWIFKRGFWKSNACIGNTLTAAYQSNRCVIFHYFKYSIGTVNASQCGSIQTKCQCRDAYTNIRAKQRYVSMCIFDVLFMGIAVVLYYPIWMDTRKILSLFPFQPQWYIERNFAVRPIDVMYLYTSLHSVTSV